LAGAAAVIDAADHEHGRYRRDHAAEDLADPHAEWPRRGPGTHLAQVSAKPRRR